MRSTEGKCKEFLYDLSTLHPEDSSVPEPHLFYGAKKSLKKRQQNGMLTYTRAGNGYGRVDVWISSCCSKHVDKVIEYLRYFGFEEKETVDANPVKKRK